MSDTDDEDLPNLKVKKRVRRQKTSKSKIEDSDSSGDETVTQPEDDRKNTKPKRILDSSSDDEEDCCNKDDNRSAPSAESLTLAADCNTALDINNLDINSTNTDHCSTIISSNNPIDNELINGSEDEQSNESDSNHHQGKQNKVKSKIRQFADSSSEEEGDGLNSSCISASKRISERVTAKKYSFRSKLDALKNQSSDNELENDGNDPTSKNENMDGEAASEATEDVPSGDISKLLENNDLFDMEESDDERPKNQISEDDDDDVVGNDHQDEVCEEPSVETKGKKKTSKAANDKMRKESRSEQQRLLREQKFNLPYHVPETKPLKDFLTRVPVMKTSKEKRKGNSKNPSEAICIKESNSDQVEKVQKPKKMDCLFLQKPTLTFGKEEVIEFEQKIEFEPGLPNSSEKGSKKKGVLDSFMARFEKHTRKPRKSCEGIIVGTTAANNYETAKEDDKVPGGRRIAFKEVMKEKIHKERCEILKETEREMKLYNEDDDDDESEYGDDEDGSSDSDEEKDATGIEKEKEIEKPNGNDVTNSQSSDDEELSKWNLEDDRKALELEMEVEEKKQEKSERTAADADAIDFSIHPIKASEQSEERLRKEDASMHWDDTSSTVSSVLPAGQGEPTSKRKTSSTSDGGRSTPFSKLVPSGLLLDSASKLSVNSSSTHCTSVLIPCENTQDLYKNDQPTTASQSDEEESESVFNNFQLYVNEDTEYTQACDSQGFLNESKKSIPRQPRQPAKRLFDDDGKDYPNDFSEVIALCSGKFEDEETTSTDAVTSKDEEIRKMCSSNSELSMSQVIGLCSGKFTEDNSTAVNSQCTLENDETSNPPIEHPFSSRIITGVDSEKESQDLPSFRDTPENIFSNDFALPKLSKPSCISELIDENFDDNAIDFCSAPFSTQTSNEISSQQTNGSRESEKLLPQTKVDVEKWLKGDQQTNGVELDEHDVLRETEGKKKTKRIVESDDDDDEGEVGEGTQDVAEDDEHHNEELLDENNGVVSSDEENEEDEVADELLEYQDAISGQPAKKKWLKNAFTEGEAELSGSDINSDDEELGSEYDEYEIDSDVENLPDAEKLKRQVHKIHQRKLMEQDQSELKKLQDMYLEDGDLGDGKKRQRNFKWRNIDNDENLGNATGAHSGDEEDELNLDTNISQKLERAEREKYIHELNESEKGVLDENSQSMLEMIKSNASILSQPPIPKAKPKLFSKSESRVLSQKQTGSFLCQKKSKLSNLSSAAKASGGGHGAKGFVFKATEDEKPPVEKENKGVQRKAPFAGPAKKRMKINPEVSESSESQSIFDLL